MKARIATWSAAALVAAFAPAAAQDPARGQEIFQRACAACHTVGGGRLVGPDLTGVAQRRSESWIIDFVRSSQQLVASGDPAAAALFAEYQQLVMPDQPLSADDVRAVLAFVARSAPAASAAPPASPPAGTTSVTAEQVRRGQDLFQGNARFANGGPTCTSCHHVSAEGVATGGALARDLTMAFARLGEPGTRAIVSAPPFPLMQRAYQDRPLEDEEVAALTGFLQRASEQGTVHHKPGFAPRLVIAGLAGSVLLLLLYSLIWGGRLTGSVHRRIYDRQITST